MQEMIAQMQAQMKMKSDEWKGTERKRHDPNPDTHKSKRSPGIRHWIFFLRKNPSISCSGVHNQCFWPSHQESSENPHPNLFSWYSFATVTFKKVQSGFSALDVNHWYPLFYFSDLNNGSQRCQQKRYWDVLPTCLQNIYANSAILFKFIICFLTSFISGCLQCLQVLSQWTNCECYHSEG